MYAFKENIDVKEFSDFANSFSGAPIQQTEAWTVLKNNWNPYFCGMYDGDSICGVCLILVRELLPGFKYAYAAHGPLLDYSNKELISAFSDGAEKFCKKNGIYSITVDPLIPVGKTLPDVPADNFLDIFNTEKGKNDMQNFIDAGFIHGGFGKGLHDAVQPRFNALIPLKKADGTSLSFNELKKNYKQKIRKYYANFQSARGLYYERAVPSPENIAEFKRIISATEKRQNISLREEDYFALLSKAFGDGAFFGFEKTDINKYIENLETRLRKEPEMAEKITEQIADAKKIAAEKGDKVNLAALLTVYPQNTGGIRIAEYLYAGSDLTIFPSFCATLCGLGSQCAQCIENGCDYLDLGGLAGTFDDGLYEFKHQFSPIIVEYAGEFTLPVNKVKYKFMEKYMPAMKKVYKNVTKLLHRQ